MTAYLVGVRGYIPEKVITNDDLVARNQSWNSDKIFANTGIKARHVAGDDETGSDLGFRAADSLLNSMDFDRSQIDTLLFCTQTPDYLLPTTACILQTRLGLKTNCAAFDFNLGCSGFVYGLWLARSLINSESARNVLLIVGDTTSKLCDPNDLATVALFGDAGSAALISSDSTRAIASIGQSILGTDGRGADHLIIKGGGARYPSPPSQANPSNQDTQNSIACNTIHMNGGEIYSFTLARVSQGIQQLLDRTSLNWDQIDLFLLHQANAFMLKQLRLKMNIPPEKMPLFLEQIGNTSGSTIPLLIEHCQQQQMFKPGFKTVLAGFGVGYSWGFNLLEWI